MVTSQMRPILTLVEDTGPGVHDTLVAACSHELYEKILGIGPEVGCHLPETVPASCSPPPPPPPPSPPSG